MTTIGDIKGVAKQQGISRNGFMPSEHVGEGFDEHDVEMVIHARAFIRAGDRPRYRDPVSSYGLKHDAEKWCGQGSVRGRRYITNGAFLVACFLEGLKPRRIWYIDDDGRRLTIDGKVRLP